jgi:hypothetical protein
MTRIVTHLLAVHVRRNVDQRSHALVPIHKSFDYLLLIKRLVPSLGLSGVFISSDDKTKLEIFQHVLGEGNTDKEPGLGLEVYHIPHRLIGDIEPIKPVPHGKLAAAQRTAGPDSRAQATSTLASMVDEEGAAHLSSLYIMSLFSSAFLGTISSHWARMVMEMQRWDEGGCMPPKAGWILPKSTRMDTTDTEAERKPTWQNRFIDMDGDSYFIGDFKVVQHLRIPQPNSPNLDPTIDE